MSLHDISDLLSNVVHQHEGFIAPLIFFLAFGESLVFLSLLLPATFILLALGLLIGKSGIAFLPVWCSATFGAFFGDWMSYWIGCKYKHQVVHMWPLSCKPQLLIHGHAFFEHWGVLGIVIGRFFGPLRAILPLVSGICGMPQSYFQLANIISAMIWAFSILAPGALGINWLG